VNILSNGFYAQYVEEAAYPNTRTPVGDKDLAIFALGLTGEAGETAELVKKLFDRNKPIDPEVMKLELGDVLWYLQALATYFGFTLEDVAVANVAKLDARKAAA
jgi:NTP pyrophosphatase (non-canonical NTP hydrolase)